MPPEMQVSIRSEQVKRDHSVRRATTMHETKKERQANLLTGDSIQIETNNERALSKFVNSQIGATQMNTELSAAQIA